MAENTILLGFITAFFIVLLATPSLIKVAKLKHLVDEPGEDRKIHRRSIPTIGGIIIFGAVLFSYALWYPESYSTVIEENDYFIKEALTIFKYLTACLILLFFVGIKDDIIGTAPLKKLLAHMLVGFILVMMGGIKIDGMHGIFGVGDFSEEWVGVLLSVFVYIVVVNAYNLIDGVDGLAAGVGFINSCMFAGWFYYTGNIPLALLAMILAGTLLGFLVFNFSPAKIFMGDSGSMVIGAIISVLAISMINEDQSRIRETMGLLAKIPTPVFAMAVLVYPLIDTIRIFAFRASRGNSPFSADKNHIHHRLIGSGLSHAKTVVVLYGYNILVVGLSIWFAQDNATVSFFIAIGIAVFLAGLILLVFRPKARKE
jgi:UDP-N-acetylmuramyl pentapeptide phosphotransferase/UDP-N-acetylglucosamine-1-phosphate transferase